MVYFILCNNEFVKIGYSANVEQRLKQLQTGNPYPLKLLLVLKGLKDTEKGIHEEFSGSRVNGEWFRYKSMLRYTINSIIEAKLDASKINVQEFVTLGRIFKMQQDHKKYLKGKKKTHGKYIERYGFNIDNAEAYISKFKIKAV